MAVFKRLFSTAAGALALLTTAAAPAVAEYPDRPITIMVGYAPGGASDVGARISAEYMTRVLNTPVIVENKPGAGGSIAASATAIAPPDGYRLMMLDPGAFAINPIVQPQNARYDPVKDFTAIALVGQSPLVLVVPASRPYKTIEALNAYLRATPTASYASSGTAGITQFGAEIYLKRLGNLTATHVPYRGGAPMLEALMKGETDFGVAVLASAVPQIQAGGVRALALLAPSTTPAVANVPLLEKSGMPGTTITSWVNMIGPRGIPPEIAGRLNATLNEAIRDPDVRERLLRAGIEAYPPNTLAEADAYLKREVETYRAYQGELGDRLTR